MLPLSRRAEFEHAVDQVDQVVGLLVDDVQEFALGRLVPGRVLAQQRGRVTLDEAERGMQFMGDGGNEIILELRPVAGKLELGNVLAQGAAFENARRLDHSQ